MGQQTRHHRGRCLIEGENNVESAKKIFNNRVQTKPRSACYSMWSGTTLCSKVLGLVLVTQIW